MKTVLKGLICFVILVSSLFVSCVEVNTNEEIVIKQTEFYEKHKSYYTKIVDLLCSYNQGQCRDIVITHYGKNALTEIYDVSFDSVVMERKFVVLNDSMPNLYNILPRTKLADLEVVCNAGVIRFRTDICRNMHKGRTSLVYNYISEDSLRQLWSDYKFFDNEIPDIVDKWFYKIEGNWYIMSPKAP